MRSQISVLLIPMLVALVAIYAMGFFSKTPRFNGICRNCGENLPRRGFSRCPWCGRIGLVLWYR